MIEWKNDTHLVVDGTDFRSPPARASNGALLLHKPRWMVERYETLRSQNSPVNVFELGIYEGGSTAFLALLFRPRRLVSIDVKARRVPALDAFIASRGFSETVHPYYGVDQADRARLEEIVAAEYGSEPLDLVIDDASHLYNETSASFNVLFPRLRPGGLYVIEDWSCQLDKDRGLTAKWAADAAARESAAERLGSGALAPPRVPLGRLVLQLVLAAAYAEGVVAEVSGVRQGWLVVRRGEEFTDPDKFDIAECVGSLGRGLLHEQR